MTTTEPTTTPWLNLDELCPPEMREEVATLIDDLARFLDEVQPTLTRAGELVARFQLESHRLQRVLAARSFDSKTPDVYEFINAATGLDRLYNAMEDLSDAADPLSNVLYAAIVLPGKLPFGVSVLVDTPNGVRRVSPMTPEAAEDGEILFQTFDYQERAKGAAITHDELIEGIIRAQAADQADVED